MLDLLVYVAVAIIILVVLWYLLSLVTLPEPIGKIVHIALVVIVALVVIAILLNITGHGGSLPLRIR